MDTIQALLKDIYSFYPVGLNSFMGSYEGSKKFREILTKKINDEIDGADRPWLKLTKELKNLFSAYQFFDMAYIQFPSYQLSVNFLDKKDCGIRLERRLILNVSLLCSFYTIFFETKIKIKGEDQNFDPNNSFGILSFHSENNILLKDVEKVRELTEREFTGYRFIHHKMLFDYKIEGCGTYSNWQEYQPGQRNPVYFYLFDSNLMLDQTIIAE
ncbi:MAG TPA: hypothetical protein PKC69_13795 [Chitinophagaceae bacterium]|nr:hypothetical protein [Chitinophagaceae bacterium]